MQRATASAAPRRRHVVSLGDVATLCVRRCFLNLTSIKKQNRRWWVLHAKKTSFRALYSCDITFRRVVTIRTVTSWFHRGCGSGFFQSKLHSEMERRSHDSWTLEQFSVLKPCTACRKAPQSPSFSFARCSVGFFCTSPSTIRILCRRHFCYLLFPQPCLLNAELAGLAC